MKTPCLRGPPVLRPLGEGRPAWLGQDGLDLSASGSALSPRPRHHAGEPKGPAPRPSNKRFWLAFLANFSCVSRDLLESILRWKRHQNRFYTAKTQGGRWLGRNLALQRSADLIRRQCGMLPGVWLGQQMRSERVTMADKNWPRGRGEASHLSNLKITTRYLDSDYDILNENLRRSSTRYLGVFSLIPKTAGKPSFHARVDDGTPDNVKDPELDIDIRGVSDDIVRDFRAGRNGYIGHHTDRSPNRAQRIFDVEIATPQGRVFKGDVFVNVTFSVAVTMTSTSSVTADATVVRPPRIKRICNWLKQLWHRITSRL